MSSGGVIVEQKGPNGWTIIGAGGLIGVALVIIALAIMQLATWAGIALIILACGQTAFNVCRGISLLIEAQGKRDRARTEGLVNLRLAGGRDRARLGPRTREDIEELFE
jgi:hypothetical protein